MSDHIDNRIVKMTFDNAQFEKGTKQSMETLEKLKKSLDFNTAVTGLDALQNQINGVSVKGLADNLTTIPGMLKMKVFDKISDMALSTIKTITTAIPNQIKTGGWNRALNIENAKFQIQGLGHEWEEVATQINYAVSGTAYGLDAAATAASQLMASGVEFRKWGSEAEMAASGYDEMATSLRAISGVAAMTNSSYEDISRIFTTIAGNGRVMGEQLNQISSRGLNAASTLANYLNKIDEGVNYTEADIRDLVSKGKIDFATFAAAMDDAFGEHAKDANKTMTGALSNIKAALSKIGEIFTTPVIQNAPVPLNAIREAFNQIKEALKPLGDTWGPLVKQVFDAFTKVVEILTPKLKSLAEIIANTLGPAFDWIANLFGKINDKLKPLSDAATKGLGLASKASDEVKTVANAVEMTTDKIEELAHAVMLGEFGDGQERMDKLGDSFAVVQNRVNEILGVEKRWPVETAGVIEATNELTDAQKKQAEEAKKATEEQRKNMKWFDVMVNTLAYVKIGLSNIGTAVSTIAGSIGTAFREVFSGFTGTVKSGIIGVAEGFASLTKKLILSDAAANKVKSVFTVLARVIKTIISGVKMVVTVIGNAIYSVGSAISKIFSLITAVNNSGKSFDNYVGVVTKAVKGTDKYTDSIAANTKELDKNANKLSIGQKLIYVITGAILKVKEAFTNLFKKVKEGFEYLKKSEHVNKLLEQWKNGLKAIKDLLGNGLDNILTFITGLGKSSADAGNEGNAFINFIDKMAEKLVKLNTAIASGGLSGLAGVIGEIGNRLKQFPLKTIEQAGQTITNIFGEVIPDALSKFKSSGGAKVGDFFSPFTDALHKFMANTAEEASAGSVAEFVKNLSVIIFTLKSAFNVDKSAKSFVNMTEGFRGIADSIKNLTQVAYTAELDWAKIEKRKVFNRLILNMAIALGVMSAALVALSFVPADRIKSSLIALTGATALLIGLVASLTVAAIGLDKFTKTEGKSLVKFAGMMLGVSVSLYLLAGAMKIFSMMNKKTFTKGAECVGILIGMFVLASRFSKSVSGGTISFAGMALAIDLLVPSVILLGKMSKSSFVKGAVNIGIIMVELAAASRIASGSIGSAGTMLGMAAVIAVLIPSLGIIGIMPWGVLIKGASAIVTIMTALAFASRLASKSAADSKSMVSMAAIVAATALSLYLLADIDFDKLLKSASILSAVMVAIGASMFLATKNAKGMSMQSVGLMGIFIAGTTAALLILSRMPADDLLKRAVGFSAVLVALGTGMYLYSKATKEFDLAKIMASIIPMAAVLGIAIGAVFVLMNMPGDSSDILAKATSLGIILEAMGTAFYVFEKGMRSVKINTVGKSILGVAALVGLSTAALAVLANFAPGDGIISKATALGIVLNSLATAFVIFEQGIRNVKMNSVLLSLIPLAGVTAAGIAAILVLDTLKGDPSALVGKAKAFSLVLGSLAIATAVVGAIGLIAPAAIAGAATLLAFLEELVLIGAAFKKFEGLKDALKSGIEVIGIMADGLGVALGKFIAGISEGVASSLPKIGKSLSEFATEAMPFFSTIKIFGPDTTKAIKNFAEAMLILTGAELLSGLANLAGGFFGEKQLDKFAESLPVMANAMKDFDDALGDGIDAKKCNAAIKILKDLADMTSEIPNSGLSVASFFVGDNDPSEWSQELWGLANGVMNFNNALGEGIDSEKCKSAIKILKSLANMTSEIPNSGLSVASFFVGENDPSEWSQELWGLANGVMNFNNALGEGIDSEKCKAAIKVLKDLANMTSEIPNSGISIAAIFVGDNDAGTWAQNLMSLGTGIKNFNTEVASVSKDICQNAFDVLKGLIDLSNTAVTMNLTTAGNIKAFCNSISNGLTNYYNVIKEMSFDIVSNSVTNVDRLIALASRVNAMDTSNMAANLLSIRDIGTNVSTFLAKMSSVTADQVNLSISAIDQIINMFNNLSAVDTNQIDSFVTAFNNLSTISIEEFTNGFTEGSETAVATINTFIDALIEAINTKSEMFRYTGILCASNFVQAIRNYQPIAMSSGLALGNAAKTGIGNSNAPAAFRQIGVYCGQGLVQGMRSQLEAVRAIAAEMASVAATACAAAAQVNSPSKVFFKLGDFFTQGLIRGIRDRFDEVKESGSSLAEMAYDAVSDPLSRIKKAFEDDEFTPVITPVLNLDRVTNQASELTGIMANRSYALATKASAGYETNVERQNGSYYIPSDRSMGTVQNINYTQNNYSPKALSRADIYRDTHSQLSLLKGVVSKR